MRDWDGYIEKLLCDIEEMACRLRKQERRCVRISKKESATKDMLDLTRQYNKNSERIYG